MAQLKKRERSHTRVRVPEGAGRRLRATAGGVRQLAEVRARRFTVDDAAYRARVLPHHVRQPASAAEAVCGR